MATNTTIIRMGAKPPGPAPGAAWAKASGIKPFMHAPCRQARVGDPVRAKGAALCHSTGGSLCGSRGQVTSRPGRQPALSNRPPDRAHQIQVEVQVVDGVQTRAEDLVAAVEVAEVGAAVVPAGVAGAIRVDWTQVGLVHAVADVDDAPGGKQVPVAGMPGRHYAIEHIDAAHHCRDDIFGTAYSHQIAGTFLGHVRDHGLENTEAFLFGLPYSQAAYCIAREIEPGQGF